MRPTLQMTAEYLVVLSTNPALIGLYCLLHGTHKLAHCWSRHAHPLGAHLHPYCILLWPEKQEAATICFSVCF